ncbi:transposase [bacterium]|nr:transposase [bacterium]
MPAVFRHRDQQPAALGRCEFGLEITVSAAFLVLVLRLSLDKARGLLAFFQELTLSKAQLDALVNRLSKAWEPEFDRLCLLLANSAVVNADETDWRRPVPCARASCAATA